MVFSFLIGILATWRISVLLAVESGPFDLSLKLREWAGISHDDTGDKVGHDGSFFARLLDCLWCLSFWVGVVVTMILFSPHVNWLLLPFAFSASAVWLDEVIRG